MGCFEKSPVGVPVVEKYLKNNTEEQTQIVRDIKSLIYNDEIKPGSIVIMLNPSKEASCLANTKVIDKFPLVSTYMRYDSNANNIYYTTIEIFRRIRS